MDLLSPTLIIGIAFVSAVLAPTILAAIYWVREHRKTSQKLDIIHLLVNSNLTAAKQAEYTATSKYLAMLGALIDLKRRTGLEPSDESLEAYEATKVELAEMRVALDERLSHDRAFKS